MEGKGGAKAHTTNPPHRVFGIEILHKVVHELTRLQRVRVRVWGLGGTGLLLGVEQDETCENARREEGGGEEGSGEF